MNYTKPYHQYRDQSNERIEELFSNYIIDSLSYSKINTFCRNEKAFEMQYIYRVIGKSSASTIAGTAYHEALKLYFQCFNDGIVLDIAALEERAFQVISEVPANLWKLQKTSPTVEESVNLACKLSSVLLVNFLSEISVYSSKIKEILGIELKLTEWFKINGVDIPLPFHLVIDLVIETFDGKTVIIDHKSKKTFSDETEIAFSSGKQAITYIIGYETATGNTIDEVWFIENKYSQNRDKSPQLICSEIKIDEDTRRLYEAMLYEPTRRVLEAVSNPDYIYLINESDNLTDTAEIHEFWAQTMLAEVDDFINIPENKKEMIRNRQRKIKDSQIAAVNPKVIKNFRKHAAEFIQYDLSNKDMSNEEKIEHVLRTFGITVKVQHIFNGYSSSTFLIEVSAGIPLATIQRHKLDIANALDVSSIRIMKDLFVYEGKSYLAVECSRKREADLLWDEKYLSGLRIPLGLDNFHRPVVWDLENQSTPHMLVCGATGSGKSVSIISSIEYALLAKVDRIVIFDPKFEFTKYKAYENISVFSEIEEIEFEMAFLVEEMNKLVKSGNKRTTLVIFDEFADAISQARSGNELKNYQNVIIGAYKNGLPKTKRECTSEDKSLEENLKILLQKGRSSGFRIIAATQRASVKVITGDAKVNFPVQLCFRVPKEVDSKVVLDEGGAEALQGKGDGLLKSPEYADVIRFQAFYKKSA
ncbi:MAG: PD-(D/E)XK nuclease family protein [Bacteroidia bacterium]|nr:PD-(D/E)XK nuclease family protein [Bacteroidia bacterium]